MFPNTYFCATFYPDTFFPPGGSVVPPTPTPTPTPSTTAPGGIVSQGRGIFTGIYRPRIQNVQSEKKLTRSQKRLLKQKELPSLEPKKNIPFSSAPNLQTVSNAQNNAKLMAAMEADKVRALELASTELMKLEASQRTMALLQAQKLLQMQQEEMALILMLDDL